MVSIFHGEDDFSLRQAIAAIKAGLGDPSLVDLNTSVLDGRSVTFPELQAHCETVPFLAPSRLVLVEGLLARFAARGRAEGDTDTDAETEEAAVAAMDGPWSGLPDLLARIPPTTTLIFIESKLAPRNPMLRAIGKSVEVREFSPLKGPAVQQWIAARVEQAGGVIAPAAVRLLADLVGDNLRAMATEIEKLVTYALGRAITVDDVETMTVSSREASIFTLVDAIMARSLTQASRTLHQLLEGGAAPPYLIFMIARQVRALLLAKDLMDTNRRLPAGERVPDPEIGRRIGVNHPFALRKTLDQARSASQPQLAATHHRLLDADLALKTGRLEGDLAVELLVVELCRSTGAAGVRSSR